MPPKTVIIDTVPIFPKKLQKDLQEGEVICTTCKGLGVVVVDNQFGLREEGELIDYSNLFPYKKQSISFCPDCYSGVRKLCKYCGQPGSRGYIYPERSCQCEGAAQQRRDEQWKKGMEFYQKAEKLTLAQAIEQGIEMVYIDGGEKYVTINDLEEEIYEILSDDIENGVIVYATTAKVLTLDAAEIVSDECESQEMYEDFCSSIPDALISELQEHMDSFCEDLKNNKTYWADYRMVIVVDDLVAKIKEEIKKERQEDDE